MIVFDIAQKLNTYESKINNAEKYSVIITGAGISGIGATIKLKEAGITNIKVFEKLDKLGGTWNYSTYPGVASDVPAHLYSYSFRHNPWWSRQRPKGEELRQYLELVTEEYDVKRHIKFTTCVKEARWNETDKLWEVKTDDGSVHKANFYVNAIGSLFVPNYPNIANYDKFKKPVIHTVEWNDKVELKHKVIGVIGTGASGVQVVPQVAKVAKKLTVFQRSAAWVPKNPNPDYPRWIQYLFNFCPWIMSLHRLKIFLYQEMLFHAFLSVKSPFLNIIKKGIGAMMKKELKHDPELKRKLIPEYQPFCKRVTPSTEYLKTFHLPHANLVTEGIKEMTEDGIITNDGTEHKLDVLILATGFDLLAASRTINVFGRDGKLITDTWGNNPRAYLGVSHPDNPNSFIIFGPNGALGYNSVIFMIECQITYMVDCIRKLSESKMEVMTLRPQVLSDFVSWVDNEMKKRIFSHGCRSYYTNSDGVNFTLWPSDAKSFWWRTRSCDIKQYDFS